LITNKIFSCSENIKWFSVNNHANDVQRILVKINNITFIKSKIWNELTLSIWVLFLFCYVCFIEILNGVSYEFDLIKISLEWVNPIIIY